jgi:hypothetical protein
VEKWWKCNERVVHWAACIYIVDVMSEMMVNNTNPYWDVEFKKCVENVT